MNKVKAPIERLKAIMDSLRNPNGGSPWDVEQTYKSLTKHTIEEAYEVTDAIEREDMADLQDELGDLLFQVIFYSKIAEEDGHFSFDDVVTQVVEKMISRHPHVFGNIKAASAEDVNDIWDAQKDKEADKSKGALSSVTKGLPALLRSQKLQKKAAKTGFVWPSSTRAFEKIEEEIREFKDAQSHEDKEEEFGDLLYALTNYARMENIDAEEALRKANNKFVKRFEGMEIDAKANEINFESLELNEMLDYWNNQKLKVAQ